MNEGSSSMTGDRVGNVLIVGGGVAAWLAALTAAKVLRTRNAVRVIELPQPTADVAGIFGGSLPPLRSLHRALDIDERAFMIATQATFRLGTEFRDWTGPQSAYFQPLSEIGAPLDGIAFHQHWLRAADTSTDIAEFSLGAVAARLGRFVHPSPDPRSILSTLDYAYHFDSELYAAWLRSLVQQRGIQIIGADLAAVQLGVHGQIASVVLDSGEQLDADMFIDCTGSAARLIGQRLKVAYEDWTDWLPCDRMWAFSSERAVDPPPYTLSIARSAGWQWRLPLQHRDSNGYVYCSGFIGDDEALREVHDRQPDSDPQLLQFSSGRRSQFWSGNCVALGAAAGFMEPLCATNLQLIHSGISRLVTLFPHRDNMETMAAEYNRLTVAEYERIRDMIVLHYHTATRSSPFWAARNACPVPEPLQHKLRVFRSRGRVVLYDEETFSEGQWISTLFGQQVWPRHADALAQTLPLAKVQEQLQRMKAAIDAAARNMPSHGTLIANHCAARR